ncbi:MAG: M48 family metallopeptidase [Verrucomicrobia bacterium]|nr:M48 family metallopeptidase [Verrucomicrobiota bacterium]
MKLGTISQELCTSALLQSQGDILNLPRVQLDFLDTLLEADSGKNAISDTGLVVGQSRLPLECVRNKRAKRYIIRLLPERVLRVTIPRGGSRKEALRFVSENYAWVEKQFLSLRLRGSLLPDDTSQATGTVLFRGRRIPIRSMSQDGALADFCIQPASPPSVTGGKVCSTAEDILRRLAKVELPKTTFRLAKRHGFTPLRVGVRNQKTRWGSCSSTGAISLNWRLVQIPAFVREYVILHELVHLDHLDHSTRFWERLAKACANHKAAEAWLKLRGNTIC